MSTEPTAQLDSPFLLPERTSIQVESTPRPVFVPRPFLNPQLPIRLGDYRLVEVLGSGGMGVVFRAEEPALGRHVAIKLLNPALVDSPEHRARFQREARTQAAIEHDHVVPIFQVGETDGIPFIAMPVLKGVSLATYLAANPKPPIVEVLRIAREIAEGLAAAHAKGLIHRDIKPGNIWLEGSVGRVKILDFGLAREAEPDGDSAEPVTSAGVTLGTVEYMSPEQARGEHLDARTDLFSLGSILYEMTAGHRPFRGRTRGTIIAGLLADDPDPPHETNAHIPEPLGRYILRLLAKHPDDRPESAERVGDDLARLATGVEIPPTRRKAKRGRRWAVALIAVAIGLGGFALRPVLFPPRPNLTEPGPLTQALLRDFHTVIVRDNMGHPLQLHPGAPLPKQPYRIEALIEPYPHTVREMKAKLTPDVPPLLRDVRELHLFGPDVGHAEVQWFAERLPLCRIHWEGGVVEPRDVD